MDDRFSGLIAPVTVLGFCLIGLYFALFRPGYLNNDFYLGAMIFLWIVIAALWKYSARFFPLLMLAFLFAGTDVPFQSGWIYGRWMVLITAALAGFVVYMKNKQHHYTGFHLVAAFCVVSAIVSAVVSQYPDTALLKAGSLLLLFLYASTGARLAAVGREEAFCRGLIFGCELLVYAIAASYLILRHEMFENQNSLGAVMGVFCVPVMLWGTVTTERRDIRRRRAFALVIAILLLLSSYARAGILAALVSGVLFCAVLRQYRLLMNGLIVALLGAAMVAVIAPPEENHGGTLVEMFVYKGSSDAGVLNSRKSAWDTTTRVLQEHPWFGSGFGTSFNNEGTRERDTVFASTPQSTREHGSSYLAIAEWEGLLGVAPFLLLLIMVGSNALRAYDWLRRTGKAQGLAAPLALITVAGLVHAGFEDWLFAVGYYVTVFFWCSTFMLVDFLPARPLPEGQPCPVQNSRSWPDGIRLISPAR